ncbi:hypothetical protein L7F22_049561 [Adiantum nelumboides]|nr:hypothetical protein [Adiantum nelumboides]
MGQALDPNAREEHPERSRESESRKPDPVSSRRKPSDTKAGSGLHESLFLANWFGGLEAGPLSHARRVGADANRRVQPADFQKWLKRCSGSGDPYDHLASFKQVLRAERIFDFHTQFEGFGMTLEEKALTWFQNIPPRTVTDLNTLVQRFVAACSKIGIKHNMVAQIYSFKQKQGETVRDCATRMNQYVARCPELEIPTEERLVSLFLEGLLNKELHAILYSKKHTTLEACASDAIDLGDNCDIFDEEDISKDKK